VWEHRQIGRLARREAQTRLGTQTAGMETKRHGGSTGGDRGSDQPVDEKRERRGQRGPQSTPSERSQAASHSRAASTNPSSTGERSVSVWMWRRRLEQPETGSGLQTGVWRELSSRSL